MSFLPHHPHSPQNSDNEELEQHERRKLKKLRAMSDSDDEEEDDEDDAEQLKDLIDDNPIEEDVSDEADTDDDDGRGADSKRKKNNSDDEQLEDDDYEMLEENLGVKIKRQKRFKRLRRNEDSDGEQEMDDSMQRDHIGNQLFDGDDVSGGGFWGFASGLLFVRSPRFIWLARSHFGRFVLIGYGLFVFFSPSYVVCFARTFCVLHIRLVFRFFAASCVAIRFSRMR